MRKRNVLILGAAGRDFHNFNCRYRDNENYNVVAFTATQIPNIEGRTYPPTLAGRLYPHGIRIHQEQEMEKLIRDQSIDVAVFSYSDVPHSYVMHMAARVNAAGADFELLGTHATMLKSRKPVVAVCAVRTGCGKSQTTRHVANVLKQMGRKIAVLRHPMPYGDLSRQVCQRYAELADMDRHECTIEEREEYELHIRAGNLLFAGVDYQKILEAAEQEADVILWDGGNNDMPFIRPDLMITVADAHRAGHELAYYPGETNFRMADVILINKVNTARPEHVELIEHNVKYLGLNAAVLRADSTINCSSPEKIKGKTVLAVEDGPTVTHGEMAYGAAHVAARQFGAAKIVDPRPFAAGSIRGVFQKYSHLREVLPAMGYGQGQIADLEATINATPCDLVLIGTPIDLVHLLKINKPAIQIGYELSGEAADQLGQIVRKHFSK